MTESLAATEPGITAGLYIDPPTDRSDGTPHRPWCSHHVGWRSTCHRPLPPVAGHGVFLMGDPAEPPTVCIAAADVVQLTVTELAGLLASAQAAIGGPR